MTKLNAHSIIRNIYVYDIVSIGAMFGLLPHLDATESAVKTPNVIFIMADDDSELSGNLVIKPSGPLRDEVNCSYDYMPRL